jgi:hypothetical protein
MSPSNSQSLLLRTSKLFFSYYALIAIIYTSYDFILKPSYHLLFTSSVLTETETETSSDLYSSPEKLSWIEKAKGLAHFDSSPWDWNVIKHKLPSFSDTALEKESVEDYSMTYEVSSSPYYRASLPQLNWDTESFPWNMSLLSPAGLKPDDHSVPVSEDFFISKVFGESFGPSKVIPYYYRASESVDKDDITITTLITLDRFLVFGEISR